MDIKEIQKIIDEQRKISPIHKKSERAINSTILTNSLATDPEWIKKVNEQNKNKSKKHKENEAKANRRKAIDPEFRRALLAGLAKRDRPYLAGEFGAFPSRSAAGRYLKENNLMPNAIRKLESVLTTETGPYRYITHEEYELILELEKKKK